MDVSEARVTIGQIIKPVGLRGEVKVFPLTDFPERFESIERVAVQARDGAVFEYSVSGLRHKPPLLYLRFSGMDSREAVASLRGGMIQVPEAERISLPESHYFQSDLLGLSVYLEAGAFLGRISDIMETGENDLFVIEGDEKEYLIPAIKKVVKKIDLKEKSMTIEPMKGLLEI